MEASANVNFFIQPKSSVENFSTVHTKTLTILEKVLINCMAEKLFYVSWSASMAARKVFRFEKVEKFWNMRLGVVHA